MLLSYHRPKRDARSSAGVHENLEKSVRQTSRQRSFLTMATRSIAISQGPNFRGRCRWRSLSLVRRHHQPSCITQKGDKFGDTNIPAHRTKNEWQLTPACLGIGAHLVKIDLDM